MSDFLDEKKAEIRARLDELRPSVDEHAQLQAALNALNSAGSSPASPGQPRRGRPRGSGTRAGQVIELLTQEPGLTANEISERIGIQVNYLYRVLPTLAEDGKISKQGRGWHLANA